MIRLLAKGSKLAYGVKYSRFYLEDLARDRVAEQRQLDQIKERQRVQNVKDLPANDSNPKNIISVRMNSNVFKVDPKRDYLKQKCWVLEPKPVVIRPPRIISATRKYIITSIKKAKAALICVKKKHVFDAIAQLQTSHKKVAKLMIRTFYNLLDHAKNRGYNPLRLWVHGCIIGKTQRYKGTRYAAKGRGYRQKTDFCQVKILLYEKPEKQFFEQIGTGKCAPGVAQILRSSLKEYNYQTLAAFNGVTTSRGRQQARLIFKRRVDYIMKQNEKRGQYQPRKLIQQQLRAIQGQNMKQMINALNDQEDSSIRLRERLFKKNMGQ